MADNDIRQKIILDGEKEYKQALKDAQRELKTLRSELKAETAELGKNATEQDKNAVKVKNLEKQIKEQEKIVRTYTEALDEVREKYADNQDEIAKWEIKLNNARATLADMRSGLEDVGQGFQKASADANTGVTAAKSFADAFSDLSGIGDSVAGAIEGIFSSTMDAVRDIATEVWDLIAETAARADAWGDLANIYGSSAEEVQSMDRAISGAGADFQQFLAFMNQLEFRGKDKGLVSWLGISDENYKDKLEFAVVAMTRLSEKQKEMGAGAFNEQLGEVFSGKSAGIMELIGEWDRVLEKRQQYRDSGYLLDDKELDTMGEVDNQLKDIQEKWDMLKAQFAKGFGTVTLDIMTNVSGALDAIAKYFDAETPEEREEALQELEKNITEAFERIAKAIEDGIKVLNEVAEHLKESEDPIVQTVGNILGGLVDVLEWLTEDNAKNAVAALEYIAGFWLMGKGLTMAAKIAEVAANMKTISLYRSLGIGGSAAGAAAGNAAGGGFLAKVGGFIAKAAPWVAGAAIVTHVSDTGNNDIWDENGNPTEEAASLGITQTQEEYERDDNRQASMLTPMEKHGNFNQYQYDILQGYWDIYRTGTATTEDWERISEEFHKSDAYWEMFLQIAEQMYGLDKTLEDLPERIFGAEDVAETPADWWKGRADENGVTSEDLQSLNALPKETREAIQELIGSIVIALDGERVADLLTDRVSQRIAAKIE